MWKHAAGKRPAMCTAPEIDHMLSELEKELPAWSKKYEEQVFLRMLASALDYICSAADPDVREYALGKTGLLVPESGEEYWKNRFPGLF